MVTGADSGIGRATFKHLDVADIDQIAEVVHGIATECEGLHIAVNSVGIEGSPGPLAGQSIEDLRRDLEVNVLCVAACMQAEAKASATDYAKHWIRINAIAPGAIDTGISKLSKAQAQHLLLDTPLGRAGQAEEIADAVVWLASERSSYVLGHTLPVDGGVVVGSTATKKADVA